MPKILINISEEDYHTLVFHRPYMTKVTVNVENLMYVLMNGTLIPDDARILTSNVTTQGAGDGKENNMP